MAMKVLEAVAGSCPDFNKNTAQESMQKYSTHRNLCNWTRYIWRQKPEVAIIRAVSIIGMNTVCEIDLMHIFLVIM